MEEIKVWSLDDKLAAPLDVVSHANTENLLEEILVGNPSMLMEGLTLVGRQTSTTGGWLDLLGVDTDGRLIVFELKRGTLNRDAITQIIDYASALDLMDIVGELHGHIAEQSDASGIQNIDNFEEWYGNNFDQSLDLLTPTRMVLVGLGIDDTAERMVNYLNEHGLDISLLTFYGFAHEGKTLLARHVEVSTADESNSTGRRRRSRGMTGTEMLNIFEKRVGELDVSELLDSITSMIVENSNTPIVSASTNQRTFRFKPPGGSSGKVYFYIELREPNEGVSLGFNPVAIDLAVNEFNKINTEDTPFEKLLAKNKTTQGSIDYEFKFPIRDMDEWKARKVQLTMLTRSVYAAYQKSQAN